MADLAYQTHSYRLSGAALVARYVEDAPPPNGYLDLTNLESRKEGSLATRYGRSIFTVNAALPGNTPCVAPGFKVAQLHTLGRLKGLNGATHRYAVSQRTSSLTGSSAGGAIFRLDGDAPGQYTLIWQPTGTTLSQAPATLSGQRLSMAEYRPSLSSQPWMFFADANLMLKDNGLNALAVPWGIPAPPIVPTASVTGSPGSGGPNVGSGQKYDYRITWYDIATGTESTPSIAQIASAFVSPANQPVLITLGQNPVSQQVTHWRIYRRGGTLNDFWYRVATVPLPTGSYSDTSPDSGIQNNDTLGGTIPLNADPPCTTNLPSPLSGVTTAHVSAGLNLMTINVDPGASSTFYVGQLVTIGVPGVNQENVYVTSIPTTPANAFSASFQYPHAAGEPVLAVTRPATPMRLAAAAYNRMWLAGDPNNPHILYYSNLYAPESFSVQNFIEVGVPSEPIMALVMLRAVLYIFTTTTVYRIVAIGATVPQPIPTSVRHGLAANFAWVATEAIVYYLGVDGMYAFQGEDSLYVSEQVEWLFQNRNLGPIAPLLLQGEANSINGVLSSPVMAYHEHEVYLAFHDINGIRKRLIYHDVYKRWRNDDIPATAMLLEEDTGNFVIAAADDPGNVYQDRVGDTDNMGFPVTGSAKQIFSPINFRLQPFLTDSGAPKAFKVYNELTVDADTGNNLLTPVLLLNSGQTQLGLANIATPAGRAQTQVSVNNGLGALSQNAGLVITGAVTAGQTAVFLYELHLRAILEAEYRRSFDTYWLAFGTEEFKIAKQAWLQYTCLDPAGISFSMYLDGSPVPAFTFNAPQSDNRTTLRVRFPAVLGRLWRLVGTTAAGDFQLYSDSHLEIKTITGQKSYAKQTLPTTDGATAG